MDLNRYRCECERRRADESWCDKPVFDQPLAVLRGGDVLQRSMVFSTSVLLRAGSVSPEAPFACESHNEGRRERLRRTAILSILGTLGSEFKTIRYGVCQRPCFTAR